MRFAKLQADHVKHNYFLVARRVTLMIAFVSKVLEGSRDLQIVFCLWVQFEQSVHSQVVETLKP